MCSDVRSVGRPSGITRCRTCSIYTPHGAIPAEFDDRAWLKVSRPITVEEAALVPAAAQALKEANPQTLLAMRRLSLALVRDAPDDQLIDACIGLEALLGQVDAELSYRIALRASASAGNEGHRAA